MKILSILVIIVIIGFVTVQLFALKSQRNIETYTYRVHKKYDTFEIRHYEAALFTSVKLNTKSFKKSSSKGFSILAGYIFGNNDRNEKIAMTSPVSMSLEDSMTMMFMVPKGFTQENLPSPNQSRIEIKKEPSKTVAALSFGGWANDEKIELYKKKLSEALETEGISHTNRFHFLGYNPPYEVINRKNEITVELNNPPK